MGKSKNPHCFRKLRAIQEYLPMDYNHQKNFWFDIDVSVCILHELALLVFTVYISNNESVNNNSDTHYAIAQDTDDVDNMEFSSQNKLP